MNEDKYKMEIEFINSISVTEMYRLTESRESPIELLSKFETYLIEQGKHINFDVSIDLIGNILSLQSVIKDLEKEVQYHRGNAFKVISDDEIEDNANDTADSPDNIKGRIKASKWVQDKLTGKL